MKHLTYANVAASLALFIALAGGTAFAASELGKESVDTKQLAKGAVTPSKLAKSSKKALKGARGATGAQGPIGLPGAPGTPGAPGKEGPRGINLEQIEHTATGSLTTIRTFDGIEIRDRCSGPTGEILLYASPNSTRIQLFGYSEAAGTIHSQYAESAGDIGVMDAHVSLDVSVRNISVDPNYSIVNLHMDGCSLSGDIIPA
jgi:hypothetical protein